LQEIVVHAAVFRLGIGIAVVVGVVVGLLVLVAVIPVAFLVRCAGVVVLVGAARNVGQIGRDVHIQLAVVLQGNAGDGMVLKGEIGVLGGIDHVESHGAKGNGVIALGVDGVVLFDLDDLAAAQV